MTACSEYSLLYLHGILVNFILEVLQCPVLVQTKVEDSHSSDQPDQRTVSGARRCLSAGQTDCV